MYPSESSKKKFDPKPVRTLHANFENTFTTTIIPITIKLFKKNPNAVKSTSSMYE